MVENIIQNMIDNRTTLVICGRLHQNNLGRIFQDRGHDARVIDLSSEPWYSENWLEDFLADADHYDELDRQFRLHNRHE